MGTVEVTLAYWNEHRQQLRQSETQRSVMTNYVLVVAAGLTGLAVQQGLGPATIPISMIVALVGLYGALASAKYHERAEYHLMQARALTKTLVTKGCLPEPSTLDDYRRRHYAKYAKLHRVRLHSIWTGLHLGITVTALAMVAAALN